MVAAYELLLLNTAIPQIQAAQSGDTYVVPRDIAINATAIISANSATDALRITQTGAGNAILVEDSANPDSTPFVVTATGDVGIGTNSPSYKLSVNSGASTTIGLFTSTGSSAYLGLANSSATTYIGNDSTSGSFIIQTPSSGFSTKLTLDNPGNLGLGVTPSAWSGAGKIIQFGNGNASIGTQHNGDANFLHNAYENPAGTFKYASNNPALRYQLDINNNAHKWYNAPSGTANSASVTSGASYTVVALGSSTLAQWQAFFNDSSNNPLTVTPTLGQVLTGNATGTLLGGGLVTQNISFTQAMTLDASGNLLVGTTSALFSSANRGNINVGGSASSILVLGTGATTCSYIYHDQSTGNAEFWNGANGYLRFGTNNTERARISSDGTFRVKGAGTAGSTDAFQISGSAPADAARLTSGGDLLVGTTSTAAKLTVEQGNANANGAFITNQTYNYQTLGLHNTATANDNILVAFGTEATYTTRGSIQYNRGAGLIAYLTTSDYRAKDISGPVVDSGALIDSVPVYMGKMKGATQERPMFIAHETPAYAHTGVKDAVDADGKPVYQQMDASALVPVMWAEIQSLRARVAQLEQGA